MIRVSIKGKNTFTNLVNYDILSNPIYSESMLYTPIDLRDNKFEEDMSDYVARYLYLGETKKDEKDPLLEQMNNWTKKIVKLETRRFSENKGLSFGMIQDATRNRLNNFRFTEIAD
jgi:hypothetical protein